MTNDEIEILKCYFVNEGLRRDSALISARHDYMHKRSEYALLSLLRAHISKAVFDKVCCDVCALLNI